MITPSNERWAHLRALRSIAELAAVRLALEIVREPSYAEQNRLSLRELRIRGMVRRIAGMHGEGIFSGEAPATTIDVWEREEGP